MIYPRGEIFKNGLIIYQWHILFTGIQYLSAKHKMYAGCQAPNADQRARCDPNELFDNPLDSTPLRNQRPRDIQRRPPLRDAGI
jgi:hypothetical protein